MIGYYNYTVILTYIGMIFGFVGITCTRVGELKMAIICLMIAGICDMFDGKIASTMKRTKQEKRFGVQIDSMSDLICFGVLPAFIVLEYAGISPVNTMISALYVLCALVRLSWFNVDEEERQSQNDGAREIYLGLPVTTAAMLLPYTYGCGNLLHLPVDQIGKWLLLVVGIAFLSPIKMKKPGNVGKAVMVLFGILGMVIVAVGV